MHHLLIHIAAAKPESILKKSLKPCAMLLHPIKKAGSISTKPFCFDSSQIRRT